MSVYLIIEMIENERYIEMGREISRWTKNCREEMISQELLDPQKWFTYQNLQHFTRQNMKLISCLDFCEKLLQNLNLEKIIITVITDT